MSNFYKIDPAACIGCETCAGECFNRAITKAPDGWGMVIDQKRCEGCGNCADICPADAIKIMPKQIPVECWDRVVGYFRPKGETNPGKRAEIEERARYSKEAIKEKTENYRSVKG